MLAGFVWKIEFIYADCSREHPDPFRRMAEDAKGNRSRIDREQHRNDRCGVGGKEGLTHQSRSADIGQRQAQAGPVRGLVGGGDAHALQPTHWLYAMKSFAASVRRSLNIC